MSGKLLMFAKLSLKSFLYDIVETFCFPAEAVAEIYKKYLIEKVYVYHILTDTDSTALQFTFISDPNSNLPEEKYGDVIFEVIITTKIYRRFDSSHKFWDICSHKFWDIDNPCLVTIAVNPKKYLQVLKKLKLDKKRKGIKKGSSRMDFENFTNRIKSSVNFDTFEKPPAEYKQVSRVT